MRIEAVFNATVDANGTTDPPLRARSDIPPPLKMDLVPTHRFVDQRANGR
jgi:hypothetical protein